MVSRLMTNKKRLKICYKLYKLIRCDLSSMIKLSGEQLFYINQAIGENTFLQACPGSGKTEVIGLKASYQILSWQHSLGGLAILTFTNSAAKELSTRIRKYADLSLGTHPHFVGTFDSWLHNFILHPFCHYLTAYKGQDGDKSVRITDQDSNADFLHNYEIKLEHNGKSIPIAATEYHFIKDWETIVGDSDLAKSLIEKKLTEEQKSVFIKNKIKFFQDGFATYADAEFLCYKLLVKYPFLRKRLSQRFPIVIIDECQDLSDGQISFLDLLMQEGSKLDFVGDIHQAIYDFRYVNPENLLSYIDVKKFKKLYLTKNFRSNQEIVNVTSFLKNDGIKIYANIEMKSSITCVLWQYDETTFTDLPSKFAALLKQYSIPAKNCAILARGKTTLDLLRIQNQLWKFSKIELFAVSLHCWFKLDRSSTDLTNALTYAGKFIFSVAYLGRADIRNQYRPQSFDSIRWRLLIKEFLNASKYLYTYGEQNDGVNWKNWSSLVKQFLNLNWHYFDNSQTTFDNIKSRIKAPANLGDIPVNDLFKDKSGHNVFRTTTIHSVKGETLDAVMLVSHKNKQSRGGHFSHWIRNEKSEEEHIRFAYVACSRPKHFLVLATPKLSKLDLQHLEKIGFKADHNIFTNESSDGGQ